MFLMGLIFLLLLLLSFAVIWLITRQTATERTIEERIANLHNSQKENAVVDPESAAIVKHNRLSRIVWLDRLLQGWDLATAFATADRPGRERAGR